MPRLESHVFICCNQREPGNARGCCDPQGTAALQQKFKAELASRRLTDKVRPNKSGCLDQCEFGPTVVIYPQGVWYGRVSESDVGRIIDHTIVGGEILTDLVLDDECLNTKGRVRPAWMK